MKVTETAIPGVFIVEPQYFEDNRGYFCETYSKRALKQYGLEADFVQDNHSFTKARGTLRGIHFQRNPRAQTKLVRCTRGTVLDVAVDLRKDSPTFAKWTAVELSAENRKQFWIPRGFGHAFLTLSDDCEMQYKTDDFYSAEEDRAIAWNDPQIGVDWRGAVSPILSAKDIKAPLLKDSDVNF